MAQAPENIGFVGIGLMGHGMAKNIRDKGYALTVFARRDSDALTDLIGRGVERADTLADHPSSCATERVELSLP